jgi:predicted nucleic-acid-binding protein
MIAVDTNVLLRIYADDESDQRNAALALLAGAGAAGIRVSVVVLAEIGWALRSVYKLPKSVIVGVFLDLLSREELFIESRGAVLEALESFESMRIDFSDCLIAALNETAGASPTYTFDLRAAALNSFALVGKKNIG